MEIVPRIMHKRRILDMDLHVWISKANVMKARGCVSIPVLYRTLKPGRAFPVKWRRINQCMPYNKWDKIIAVK